MTRQRQTVRDVISACNIAEVAEAFFRNDSLIPESISPDEKEEKIQSIIQSLEWFRRKLFSLPVAENTERYIMLALKSWDDGEGVMSCLYKEKDFEKLLDQAEKAKIPDIGTVTPDNAEEIAESLYPDEVISGYGYEFMPWGKVLAAQVLQGNVDRIGLNPFAADILWNMSFNGMTEESQKKRADELEASVKEVEEIQKLPEEEQEKKLHRFSMDELYEKFGLTPPTREEREETRKQMYFDTARTNIAKLEELRKIRKEKDYVSGLCDH